MTICMCFQTSCSALNDFSHAGDFIMLIIKALMKSEIIGFFDSSFLRIMASKDTECF